MWGALFGALVGGFLAMAGAFAVELRRDRRRKMGAARLVYSEAALNRAAIESFIAEYWDTARADPALFWKEWTKAIERVRVSAWNAHSSEFIASMPYSTFARIDAGYHSLADATDRAERSGEGSMVDDKWVEFLRQGEVEVGRLARPTWFDRFVWRL